MADEADGPMPPILAFATMDEIIDELKRRHDAVLVVWEGKVADDPEQDITAYKWGGGGSRALGLAMRAQRAILNLMEDVPDDTPADEA